MDYNYLNLAKKIRYALLALINVIINGIINNRRTDSAYSKYSAGV